MSGWRGTWAKAQITGMIFSTLIWVVVAGLSSPGLALFLAVGVASVAARNSRAMLWWRHGAVQATDFQRGAILASTVPIALLRGRHQPSIWIGRRLAGTSAVMPTRTDLVVSPAFVSHVVNGQLTDRQASAIVSQALGRHQVHGSYLVNAMNAYCLPWRLIQVLTCAASQVAGRNPVVRFSWQIRWIVFGAAGVDSYRNGRWAALTGVILIALLSWSTGHFQNRWLRTLQDLGDQRAISEGLGPDLADLIQRGDNSLVASERVDRLHRGLLDPTTGAGGTAPGGALRAIPKRNALAFDDLPFSSLAYGVGSRVQDWRMTRWLRMMLAPRFTHGQKSGASACRTRHRRRDQ